MACELTLQQVLEATGGKALATREKLFHGVGTDTRKDLANQIFIALKGENFDAHKFLAQAVEKGAKCLVVHDETAAAKVSGQVSVVVVKDTLKALQDLGRYWRRKLKAKVFALTGSNGKTTTKEFTATIMASQFKVHFNRGSYNNHWGVPLTLLGASKFDEAVVVEMGMNHEGEITELSKVAEPDVVLCTTVGRAHIGNFGGSQQAIADAKEEIYLANPKAIKIFNYDNEYTLKMYERVSKLQGSERTIVFSSFSAGAEVSFRAVSMSLDGLQLAGHIAGIKGEAKIPVFGRHNVTNLMAAASMALAMRMEPELIWASLAKCRGEWGRNQLVKLNKGTNVLFDAYNANPDSMAALIKNVLEMNLPSGAKKVAVLGEMLELGEDRAKLHEELGEMVGNSDFDVVWFMGASHQNFASGLKTTSFSKTSIFSSDYEDVLANKVASMLNPQDVVIMKGSRGMHLERVMKAWHPQFASYS